MICSLLQASGSFPAFVLGFLSSPVPGPSRPPAPHGPAATQPCRTGPRPRRAAAGPCPQPLKSGIIVSNKAPGSTGVCSSAAQPKPSIKSVSGAGSALPKAGGAPDWPWLGKFWSTGAAQKPPTCVFQSPRDGLCVCFFWGVDVPLCAGSNHHSRGAAGQGDENVLAWHIPTGPASHCTAAATDGHPRSWARTPRQRIHGEGCCLLAAAPRAGGGEAGAMDPASLPASFIRLESQD